MEPGPSLLERFEYVCQDLVVTNQRMHDLGVEAEYIIIQATQQFGSNEVLEQFKDIAQKAKQGVFVEKKNVKTPKDKRCKWWNKGYCREGTTKCLYSHPTGDCQQHLQEGRCSTQGCKLRHRKMCKYWGTPAGCFRKEHCQYLHQHDPVTVEKVTEFNEPENELFEKHPDTVDEDEEDQTQSLFIKPCSKSPANKEDTLHKSESEKKDSSKCNSILSFEEQNKAWEEEKKKDIQNFKDIEKLLKECEKDMQDENE